MGSEKFCLSWNDFESNISLSFRELREEKDFFDVTLSCGDEQIQAHKLILSACSPFFRSVLKKNVHQHPLLYLKGVKFCDLQAVLNFMYHGEVNVAQEELNSFLAVAEDLQVKGLTQNSQSAPQKTMPSIPFPKQNPRPPPDRDPVPPPKRAPRPLAAIPANNHDDDIQEVVPVKSEPRELPPPPQRQQEMYSQDTQPTGSQEISPMDESLAYQQEDSYEEFGGYEADQSYEGGMVETGGLEQGQDPSKGEKVEFEAFMQANATLVEGGKWSCFLCGKITSHIGNMRQHFETYHYKTSDTYSCKLCGKQCPTKNALACHKVKCRRKMFIAPSNNKPLF